MDSGHFDGSNRHHFFQRLNIHPGNWELWDPVAIIA